MTYNTTGKRITSENLAGQVTTTAWDGCFAYGYNEKSELTNAVAAVDSDYRYAYDFDEIGNRETSSERGTNAVYAANSLNQYTAVDDFLSQFDDDGNQTLVKTATGIWSVTYNGENRPILWECVTSDSNTQTLISMSYDRMGRRVTKNGLRFVYNGYLQIANFEHQTSNTKLQTFIWDPTEPVATCPLVWLRDNHVEYYIYDGNKNVSEVVVPNFDIVAHYEYAPFGFIDAQSGVFARANPWRFSSEFTEEETGMVYYNYRHYEPGSGRWMNRDLLFELDGPNIYCYMRNCCFNVDILGLACYSTVWGVVCYPDPPQVSGANSSTCVVPVDLSFISDMGYFDYASEAYATYNTVYPFGSPSDFVPNAYLKKCECVRNLTVVGHGQKYDGGRVQFSAGRVDLTEDNEYQQISNLFFGVRFCDKCHITLYSCWLGVSPVLAENIKRKTGCSVKLYDRPVIALPLLDPLVGLVYWLRRNVRPIIIAPVILL